MALQYMKKTNTSDRSSIEIEDSDVRFSDNFSSQDPSLELSTAEIEIIKYFVHLTKALGLPKSIGEIYGLLFCSPKSLTIPEIMKHLNISKGSTSQGLRFLGNINAINISKKIGIRSDFYSAEVSLRKLLNGFLDEQIEPHLKNGHKRISEISEVVDGLTSEKKNFLKDRVKTIQTWNNKGHDLIPLLVEIVGSK